MFQVREINIIPYTTGLLDAEITFESEICASIPHESLVKIHLVTCNLKLK